MNNSQNNQNGNNPLKIRAVGKYYQIGYYAKGNWINVEHIGSAEAILRLVRNQKPPRTNPPDVSITSPTNS